MSKGLLFVALVCLIAATHAVSLDKAAATSESKQCPYNCALLSNPCAVPTSCCCNRPIVGEPPVRHEAPPMPALPFHETEARLKQACEANCHLLRNPCADPNHCCCKAARLLTGDLVKHVAPPQPALPFRESERPIMASKTSCPYVCSEVRNPCSVPNHCCCGQTSLAPAGAAAAPAIPGSCPFRCDLIRDACSIPNHCCCNQSPYVAPEIKDPNQIRVCPFTCALIANPCADPSHCCCSQRIQGPQFLEVEADKAEKTEATTDAEAEAEAEAEGADELPEPAEEATEDLAEAEKDMDEDAGLDETLADKKEHIKDEDKEEDKEDDKDEDEKDEEAFTEVESSLEAQEEACPFQCATVQIQCSSAPTHCCCRQEYIAPEYKPAPTTCTVVTCQTQVCTTPTSCPNQVAVLTATQAAKLTVKPNLLEMSSETTPVAEENEEDKDEEADF